MLAIVTESKARASAGLTIGVYPICIALTTTDLDQVTLNLDLEWILLQLNECATTTVNSQWLSECNNLSSVLGYVTDSLATIHQVSVVGLYVALPHCSFLNGDH